MTLDLMLELAWKSGLIAGTALVGASLLRGRPAAERVAVLRLGVVMLLALPLLVALLPALRVQTSAFVDSAARTAAAVAAPPAAPATAMGAAAPRIAAASTPPLAASPEWRLDPLAAAAVLWAAGFGFLVLRLLAGVTLLHRWTRRAESVADPRWLAALARTAEGRTPPVLLASPRVTSPLSWGWRPAVILLDPAALDLTARADAVLAHEMGHVRHGDWLFLMASRLLVALFWFNPLVWILQRELARQSEQAADAWAAGRIGRADYATALVAMAARGRPHAALGMAAPKGELARRVMAIMNASAGGGKPWRAALTLTTCLGFATPLAAVELAPTIPASASPSEQSPMPTGPAASAAVAAAGAVAREMRADAAGLGSNDRAVLTAQADGLMREAAARRAEARDLAARDSAALQPPLPGDGIRIEPSGAFRTPHVERDASGAIRTAGGVQVEASGALSTSGGFRIDASGKVRVDAVISLSAGASPSPEASASPGRPVGAAHAARQRADDAAHMREGVREMLAGAADIDAGAADMERSIAENPGSPIAWEGPARVAEMRRQAADLRRQAAETSHRADLTDAS